MFSFAALVTAASFAAAALGLPVPATLPVIEYRTPCEVQRAVQPGHDCRVITAYAAYLPGDAVLLLPLGFDWRDLHSQSIVVHELAHHVQREAGRMRGMALLCPGYLEGPAFTVQDAWLRAHGSSLAAHGWPVDWIVRISQCAGYGD